MRSRAIKTEFGRILKRKRVASGMSRAALSVAIGASKETIKSWEYGNSFIEDLSLIGPLESAIGAYVPAILDEAYRAVAARSKS